MWREDGDADPEYTDVIELDMSTVEPSIAGPKRPQDRIAVKSAKQAFHKHLEPLLEEREQKSNGEAAFEGEGGSTGVGSPSTDKNGVGEVEMDGQKFTIKDGDVLIAAITSCTNTSNPAVMIGAGLLARKARERGINVKPWVKTSLAPGSKVVTDYLKKTDLLKDLEALNFHLVGYGCTTCIGNSGPLRPEISKAVHDNDLVATSVLSGNRNFEGRIHPAIKMNFLASPPLVVAYAIAGTLDIDLMNDPLAEDKDGKPVYFKDLWPDSGEIQELVTSTINSGMFHSSYSGVFAGDENWNSLDVPEGDLFDWDDDSTYVKNPPYFEGMGMEPGKVEDIKGARCLALLGDSVTTDHISPAGAIPKKSPAGEYLISKGVEPAQFNSFGSRRGNHEVMMRGTFGNVRLRNLLAPGTEGGWTRYQPEDEEMSIYDASMKYQENDVPLVVIAGKEYGTGSSRDWAAKGTRLLGVKAVITESYERIHRSNLIGMGVLPLQFKDGDSAEKLGLTGKETFDITDLDGGDASEVTVTAKAEDGKEITFQAVVRLDTPKERDYFQHGGILHYVLRQLIARKEAVTA